MRTLRCLTLTVAALAGLNLAFAQGAVAAGMDRAWALAGAQRAFAVEQTLPSAQKRGLLQQELLMLAGGYYYDDDYYDDDFGPGDAAAIIGGIISGIIVEKHRQRYERKCFRWAERCDYGDYRACRKLEYRCGGYY